MNCKLQDVKNIQTAGKYFDKGKECAVKPLGGFLFHGCIGHCLTINKHSKGILGKQIE